MPDVQHLRVTLGQVPFMRIQENPGFEGFADQFQDAMSEAAGCRDAGCRTKVSKILKLLSGDTGVDFFIVASDDSHSLNEKQLEDLAKELRGGGSSLQNNDFARKYIVQAHLYIILDDSEQLIKPKEQTGEDAGAESQTAEEEESSNWVPFVIVGVLVLCCCMGICHRVCQIQNLSASERAEFEKHRHDQHHGHHGHHRHHHEAATKIQKIHRGNTARREVKARRDQKRKEVEEQSAALKIQSATPLASDNSHFPPHHKEKLMVALTSALDEYHDTHHKGNKKQLHRDRSLHDMFVKGSGTMHP
eukprot:gnl/MRDRNA2_/MRDRNA2_23729_c0_seq1.p1 gnl/MRDRNA2_/MRDRNA2_23729_c0~~gnl/MRDRNA2_/MRDRNA2_23729_c0_seq1.p1  ORF type:complete len:313 (+),score=69.40 gnl/MRDRNA2_/MRDRNA2_23729_c0_seq1:30-941(+)